MKKNRSQPLATDYTDDERKVMLAKMRTVSDLFYRQAIHVGVHAFVEFAGLMNEFIKVCEESFAEGTAFEFASTHSGKALAFKPYHLRYLAEKLGCIYGPTLFGSETNRDTFIHELFDGQAEVVPSGLRAAYTSFRDVVWTELGIEGDDRGDPLAIVLARVKGYRERIAKLEAELEARGAS